MKYKVTNIGNTLQILYDKRGKRVSLKKGESAIMEHPPEDSYQFKVTKTDKKEETEKQEEKPEKNKELKGRNK